MTDSIITFTRRQLGLTLSPYQETLLRAIKAIPDPTDEQIGIYRECTGNTVWPATPPTEVVVIAGVRSARTAGSPHPSCCGKRSWLATRPTASPGSRCTSRSSRRITGPARSYMTTHAGT